MQKIFWNNLSIEDAFLKSKSSRSGLSEKEISKRLEKYGLNVIPSKPRTKNFEIALRQIKSSLVLLLFVAALISLFLGEFVDAGVILFAVFLNTIMGFVQEVKAEKALESMSKMIRHSSLVVRSGIEKEIGSHGIVPGDILVLRSGDRIPADGRIVESYELEVDEAVLTGESLPVKKHSKILAENDHAQTFNNMVYMGSSVVHGRGLILVVKTGTKTKFGEIASLLDEMEETKTPLQIQLDRFSDNFGKITIAILLWVMAIGVYRGINLLDIFMTSVAVAVAAIPEGMLVAVTIILAVGMQRTLRTGSLIRKLSAVETLGSVTLICTDKTGTLTKGTMQLDHIVSLSSVTKIDNNVHKELVVSKNGEDSEHMLALKIGMICNDAVIENPDDEIKDWIIHGTYTEKAFLWAGMCAGFDFAQIRRDFERVNEIPFNSERKFMATLNKQAGNYIMYAKGSAEEIVQRSSYVFVGGNIRPMSEDDLRFLKRKQNEMSRMGLRVLAVSFKKIDRTILSSFRESNDENIVSGMVFVALVALKDPLRPEAKETIRLANTAGVKTIIITGDNALTAKAIATELGMRVSDENILEGEQLDKMTQSEFNSIVSRIKIYARVAPHHKSRIVDAWQSRGEVVAMTGDGVNDAPALKKADIGIALGSGTEVAKGTADIVLLDDNFRTIVSAIEQGRIIFNNIRKVILYLVSDSFSEVVVISGSLLMGLAMPITAAQILWINLITDSLPNVALTFEPGEGDVMKRGPRAKNEPVFNRELKILVLAISIISGIVTLIIFNYILHLTGDITRASSIAFSILAVDSLFYVFSIRFLNSSMFSKSLLSNLYLVLAVLLAFVMQLLALYNPFLQSILGTKSLNILDWLIIIFVCIINVLIIEIIKAAFLFDKKK